MQYSRPIEANGRFIAVAVAIGKGWRVVPVDPAVTAAAQSDYNSEAEAVSAARQAMFMPGKIKPILIKSRA